MRALDPEEAAPDGSRNRVHLVAAMAMSMAVAMAMALAMAVSMAVAMGVAIAVAMGMAIAMDMAMAMLKIAYIDQALILFLAAYFQDCQDPPSSLEQPKKMLHTHTWPTEVAPR